MKKIIYVILSMLAFFALSFKAEAAASLSAPSSVSNGSSFTVSVNLSGVASWEVHVSASGPVSGCTINAADATENAMNGSKRYSASCRATGTGTIKINLTGNTTTASGSKANISSSRTVNVTNKTSSSSNSGSKNSSTSRNNSSSNKTDSKSSNNALKSLSIEGQKISPDFDKDKTDYSLTVPNETKTIKINAEASDSKSTITGTGEKEVKEGDNKFEVVVTAENGDKKTYTINVKVDTKPIIVKINGKEFTVIKNRDELPELGLEKEETTLNIDEQDVPAYRIDKLNCILIGLKDEDGKIRYYIFNSYKDKEKPVEYTLFRELTFPKVFISYLDFPEKLIPEGYNKYKIKIGEEEVDIYKKTKKSRFGLFYGVNIETGEKNIYKYDSKENTVQVYSNEDEQELKEKIETGLYIVVGLIGLSSLLLLIIVILLVTRKKLKKKIINKLQKQLNN